MHLHPRHFLTLLNRLGLWLALPLLLALLPYQQANLHSPQVAAVSVQTPLGLVAPLKTSQVKPAVSEPAPRLILLANSATSALPPHRPGFHFVVTQRQSHRVFHKLNQSWHARAPPALRVATLI
ncbi:MAG: hypothetical protein V4586_15580 [Pseudomonadota bacterium]